MEHVPQFIAYTNFPLGFTSKQVVEAQHSLYDALYHRYHTSSVISSTYPQSVLVASSTGPLRPTFNHGSHYYHTHYQYSSLEIAAVKGPRVDGK